MNPILKMKLRRIVDVWYWKATSEREATANHAWRILHYREMAEKLTATRMWMILVAMNVILFTMMVATGKNLDWVNIGFFGMSIAFLDFMIGISWGSMKMAKDPIYDWAEEYRDLIAERRAFRQEEFDNDLPRRKF